MILDGSEKPTGPGLLAEWHFYVSRGLGVHPTILEIELFVVYRRSTGTRGKMTPAPTCEQKGAGSWLCVVHGIGKVHAEL